MESKTKPKAFIIYKDGSVEIVGTVSAKIIRTAAKKLKEIADNVIISPPEKTKAATDD